MTIEKVIERVAEHLDIEAAGITFETTFEDLGIDSLDTVELMMGLEEVFNIEIEPENAGKSVGSLAAYIDTIKE